MKTIYYCPIFALLILFASCKKSNLDGAINAKLTNCPANSDCTYQYAGPIDFDSQLQSKPGNFRSFYYVSINHKMCEAQTKLYFKTGLENKDFSITKSDILNGAADYKMVCACCTTIDMVPIDGYIKGSKKDNERWLINAHIVLGTRNGTPIDTLDIRQYFTALQVNN
jgi:hypothetical protein